MWSSRYALEANFRMSMFGSLKSACAPWNGVSAMESASPDCIASTCGGTSP
jgi:hypothetical protein